ncbi:hypothetical protein CTA1_1922 [Colletotrichum tanaceti]|uniref:Uncharacterized protein n=1 Tax=Colletotrichum tanaceti TaxID=1306861 RepID=A0A4U6XBA6_9PEZI|nr:hypothetical protein CTA1_1922 [Colletotrichum tanaceti]
MPRVLFDPGHRLLAVGRQPGCQKWFGWRRPGSMAEVHSHAAGAVVSGSQSMPTIWPERNCRFMLDREGSPSPLGSTIVAPSRNASDL